MDCQDVGRYQLLQKVLYDMKIISHNTDRISRQNIQTEKWKKTMLIYLFKIEDAEILFRITEVSVGNTLLTTTTNTQVSGPTKVVGEEISS